MVFPKKGVIMDKQKIYVFFACISIIAGALIIGLFVSLGAKTISKAINEKGPSLVAGPGGQRNIPDFPQGDNEMPQPGAKRVGGVSAGANTVKGKPGAKVLIVEFSDFQCPFSKRFYTQTFPMLEKEYIDTGKVKFAYRDFPLGFHPQAMPAAIACECAGKQGKYWQMFDKLSTTDSLETESLKKYAVEIGVDAQSFNDCLDGQKTKGDVDADLKEAMTFGVKGTPAFFINGRLIEGALPFEVFKKIIDEELSK